VDDIFFKHEISSLQAKQDELDRLVFAPVVVPAIAELEAGAFTLLKTSAAVNTAVGAMHNFLRAAAPGQCVIPLDGEWDTVKDARGKVIAEGPMALIQLGYFEDGGGGGWYRGRCCSANVQHSYKRLRGGGVAAALGAAAAFAQRRRLQVATERRSRRRKQGRTDTRALPAGGRWRAG
jgi:hypothetical protein